MRRSALVFGLGIAGLVIVASCGARTGLDIPLYADAAAHDGSRPDATTHHPRDATLDHMADVVPGHDAHPLDARPECAAPAYCDPANPNYIYKCGVPIYQCSSLEQCEEMCGDGGILEAGADASGCQAECVNPCLNTLGQNTSAGCEFYTVEMDTTDEVDGACYAVFIVNQWKTGQAAKLAVDLGGVELPVDQFARIPTGTGHNITYSQFDSSVGIPQNQIAILFLSRDPAALSDPDPDDPRLLASCPPGVTAAVQGDAALHGTGFGTAFHIRSNVPIVAYQMLPYGGGSARVTGATLLLPVNVWGTNYLAANTYQRPVELVGDGGYDSGDATDSRAGPSMVIIAQADDTHVTMNPVTAIVGGPGVPPSPAGQPVTYIVDQASTCSSRRCGSCRAAPSSRTSPSPSSPAPRSWTSPSRASSAPTTASR